MRRSFIESPIRRRRRDAPGDDAARTEAHSERGADLAGASAEAVEASPPLGVITRFWRDALVFVPLDTLIEEHRNAPAITIDEAAAGKSRALAREGDDESEAMERDVLLAIGLARPGWDRREPGMRRGNFIFAIPARVTAQGSLVPAPDAPPFFNPRLIESSKDKNDVFITSKRAIETWSDGRDLPLGAQEWQPIWDYAKAMLQGAILEPASNLDEARVAIAELLGKDPGECEWIVKVLAGTGANPAVKGIKALYDRLLDPDEAIGDDRAAYERFALGAPGTPAFGASKAQKADVKVVGHMDGLARTPDGKSYREIFPLDPSQRNVVRHAVGLRPGEVQAVNGPPGTGKTSILQAVISSYWVRAALRKKRPPIIVGCGATNQSVTNITEAFISAPHVGSDYALAERWNPLMSSYGVFFPSSKYAKNHPEQVEKYQGFKATTKMAARTLFTLLGTRNPFSPNELEFLERAYVDKAAACNAIRSTSVEKIVQELHALLKKVALDTPKKMRELTERALAGGAVDPLAKEALRDQLLRLVERQGEFARQTFHVWVEAMRASSPAARRERLTGLMDDGQCDESVAMRLALEGALDCSLRPHAFHIAARYWEGRFLLAQRIRLFVRSEENVRDSLERICMLAPCIVSTINSLPALFKVKHPDPERPRSYAYAAASLLIMDESGQAVPEQGAACFALTQRALVVGDLQQLEPVSNLQEQNELAILSKTGSVEHYPHLIDTQKAPSNGAVLAVAQQASAYHDGLGRGLTLLFHYRCVRPIIEYCNRLCYGGRLIAKTGTGEDLWPPPIAWVGVEAAAQKQRGSWVNHFEATEIANWLRMSWPRLHDESGGTPIDALVAVLSAFRPQVDALRATIAQAFGDGPLDPAHAEVWPTTEQLNSMTIGTVHALQGAERPIVIFSGTVSVENTSDPFFNASPSMLNVAVSRAKRSFLFFGDPRHLFDERAILSDAHASPATVLGDHLRSHPLARRLYPKHLVIVEAPGKAAALREILGLDYEVFATHGSIRTPGPGDHGLGLDRGLRPRWQWVEKEGKPGPKEFAALARRLDDFEEVYLATDADMEGEAIAWHVLDVLAETAGPGVWTRALRVRLGAITPDAVKAAFGKPGSLDRNAAGAAIARAIADRIVAARLMAEVNREATETEAAAERDIVAKLPRAGNSPARDYYGTGRVQAAILRMVYESVKSRADNMRNGGRFRIAVTAETDAGRVYGYVTFEGEIFVFPPKICSAAEATEQLQGAVDQGRLPTALSRYETDGVDERHIAFGPPPFLSTIEIMRRAWRRGYLPWRTMEALQFLYLGKIAGVSYEEDFE